MQKLMSLLAKKYKKDIPYIRALALIQSKWGDIMKDLASQIQPINIYKNELMVGCVNPMWQSEIDYFKPVIIEKIHALFKANDISIKLVGVKPVIKAQIIPVEAKNRNKIVPPTFEERIQWAIHQRKENGATLCQMCEKVWDKTAVCRICQLTQGA